MKVRFSFKIICPAVRGLVQPSQLTGLPKFFWFFEFGEHKQVIYFSTRGSSHPAAGQRKMLFATRSRIIDCFVRSLALYQNLVCFYQYPRMACYCRADDRV